MIDLISKIQNWYKINCNGDWEHRYGISISTLDNPGWSIQLDLTETPLEGIDYKQAYQNPEQEHDWFYFQTKGNILDIACSPENLTTIFQIFFDQILPNYANPTFSYQLYLPLPSHHDEIWTPCYAKMVNEESLKVHEIPPIDIKHIKVRNLDQFDFDELDLSQLELNIQVGDMVNVGLEEVFDGVILTAILPS